PDLISKRFTPTNDLVPLPFVTIGAKQLDVCGWIGLRFLLHKTLGGCYAGPACSPRVLRTAERTRESAQHGRQIHRQLRKEFIDRAAIRAPRSGTQCAREAFPTALGVAEIVGDCLEVGDIERR